MKKLKKVNIEYINTLIHEIEKCNALIQLNMSVPKPDNLAVKQIKGFRNENLGELFDYLSEFSHTDSLKNYIQNLQITSTAVAA